MTQSRELVEQLRREVLMARQRVYQLSQPTPLEVVKLPHAVQVFLKREDMSPIHSFKWRGAYNKMALLRPEELDRGVVTASAGNHAQGIALAARQMGVRAKIFMPQTTPRTKIAAVRIHGGEYVEVILCGDTYDVASQAAREEAENFNRAFIPPFDDLQVMAGQGTLADEIVMSGQGPFDAAFIQIGGGGLASAVGCWLKSFYPDIRLVGVEGVDQASMSAAITAGQPVPLDNIDVFCDGTAVKTAGDLTYALCRELIDEYTTVTNDEVCAAIQLLWEKQRCVPEPAGAMGLAGIIKNLESLENKKVISIVCGSNMDFEQLAWIARRADIGAARRHYLRLEIEEKQGTLFGLLDNVFDGLNIVEFQYGKCHPDRAWPVLGFEVSPAEMKLLNTRLNEFGIPHEDVTAQEDVDFGIIHYDSGLMHLPFFIKLEFHDRPGALHDFLKEVSPFANLCYFNYRHTGERVGRSLLGFEFSDENQKALFKEHLANAAGAYRSYTEISASVLHRIL